MKHSIFKKVLATIIVSAMFIAVIPSSAAKTDAATKVKLSKKTLKMEAGTKKTIKVKGKKIKKVKWKSTDNIVVAVKKSKKTSAKLTAKQAGVVKVKAIVKLKTGKTKTLTCKVTVLGLGSDVPMVIGTEKPNNTDTNNLNNDDKNKTEDPKGTGEENKDNPDDNKSTDNPDEPTPEPTPSGPTPVPELDENNLAVANYPTIFSDVPDPDFVRVGGNYYMVSTTMNMSPGAPIMKSTDLVHWKIVNYVYDTLFDDDRNNLNNGQNVYRNGSWAAAIRYDEESGLYYVAFNSNGYGFFIFTTDDIENGTWKRHFIKANFHDPGLLIENGKIYVFFGGGPNNVQQVALDDDKEEVKRVGQERAIIQKSGQWGLWEGCHAYHIGDYYYVMIIASPNSGWFRSETCYRTKGLFESNWNGQWEEQIIFQGSTYEYGTGIAQGGIADTIYGDWYGLLFQDHDAIGRIPSILAVNWNYKDKNGRSYKDWPMMGYYDNNGDFVACVSTRDKIPSALKVRLNNDPEGSYIVDSDDFDYEEGEKPKLVWQWNHNPDPRNYSFTENPGFYRIKNGKTCENVWRARNSLTQRTVGPKFTVEACMVPSSMKSGDYAGLVAVGSDYGMVGVRCDNGRLNIFQGSGKYDSALNVNATANEVQSTTKVYLKIEYQFNTGNTRADNANFFWSLDGNSWNRIGNQLQMSFSTSTTFMGARTWLSNYATRTAGGYVDFDSYKIK